MNCGPIEKIYTFRVLSHSVTKATEQPDSELIRILLGGLK